MKSDSFNLLDEKWIRIAGQGMVSLYDVFKDNSLKYLGGSALEKLSVFKLCLAIAQAAYTPENDSEWNNYTKEDLSRTVCDYLKKYHDRFFLHGAHPFLQFPKIETMGKKEKKPFSTIQSYVASGNTTVRTQNEAAHEVSNDEAARLLLIQMNFAFGGKQVDNSIVLTPNYKGKSKSGKVGSGLGYLGYLHSYFTAENLLDSIRLNLLTLQDIRALNLFTSGVGTPSWEKMPTGENDETARAYRNSLIGRLVSLGRFCLLDDDGLYLTEGLSYLDHSDGVCDPAVTLIKSKNKIGALWTNTEKKPWRELTAILSFLSQSQTQKICYQLKSTINRVKNYKLPVSIWSSGLKVSSNSGEFKVAGRDDFVDSSILFEDLEILNEAWFSCFEEEISQLEKLGYQLSKAVENYYTAQGGSKEEARKGTLHFWEICGDLSTEIINVCIDHEKTKELRHKFSLIAKQCYDEVCPCGTARQIKLWAEHRLHTYKYEQMGG